jgi:hypothetical protein
VSHADVTIVVMSFEVWQPFMEGRRRGLWWRLLGRRRFADVRVVGDRIHLERAGRRVGVLAAVDVTEIRVEHKSWPHDSDSPERSQDWFADRNQVWLALRTAAGRRYASGPASLTSEQRAALVAAWRNLGAATATIGFWSLGV